MRVENKINKVLRYGNKQINKFILLLSPDIPTAPSRPFWPFTPFDPLGPGKPVLPVSPFAPARPVKTLQQKFFTYSGPIAKI